MALDPETFSILKDAVARFVAERLVPAANIIGGEPGKGFKTAMKVLDRGREHAGRL